MKSNNLFTKLKKRVLIGEICSFGVFLALLVITRAIFKYVDLINGYSPQVQMLIYSLAIFMLQTFRFRICYCLFSPFLLLAFGINGHIFFDYILPYWGFASFAFLPWLINRCYSQKIQIITLITICILFSVIGHCVMLLSYFLSGVVFYKVNAAASIIINGPVVGISAAINVPLTAVCIFPLYLLKNKINDKIYY